MLTACREGSGPGAGAVKGDEGWQLVGWLRLTSADAQKLVPHRGDRGVFIQIQPDKPPSKPPDIFWQRKEKDEACDQYLRRVLQMASERQSPVRLRRGMGSDLGVDRKPEDTVEPRLKNLDIAGVPPTWQQEELEELLASQGWTQIRINHRRTVQHRPVWEARAMPPQGSKREGLGSTNARTFSIVSLTSLLERVCMRRILLRFVVPRKNGVLRLWTPRIHLAEDEQPSAQCTLMEHVLPLI